MTAQEELGKLAAVRIRVEAELGRTELSLRELLRLGPGYVIALPAGTGMDLDIRLGGVAICEGEHSGQ